MFSNNSLICILKDKFNSRQPECAGTKAERGRIYRSHNKQFKDNYPQTKCKVTPKGIEAFENYVKALQDYLQTGK